MGYDFDDDPARVQVDVVWEFLSTQAYWERWRTRADVEEQLRTAWRVVGCYEGETGALVSLARAVSDGVAFAYLADVFVLPQHRGHGLGKELVRRMVEEQPGAGFRWLLHTKDAHGLYEQFGFREPPQDRLMERPHVSTRG
jgi:GNAT superfamily N-acetyltransferase